MLLRKLKDVLNGIDLIDYKGNLENEVTNITSDSRNIEKDGLFVAVIGYVLDGTKFIPSAIEKGASAIMVDETVEISSFDIPDDVCIVKVKNIRYQLAIASCNCYLIYSRLSPFSNSSATPLSLK